jgi:outer membrane protein assembly factor BamA
LGLRAFVVKYLETMIALSLLATLLAGVPQAAPPNEVVAEVQVRGNVATSDEELRRLAGIDIGMAVDADTVSTIAARLRATRRFDRVEVLKRYASIADSTKITIVVIVDEGAVSIKRTNDPANPTRVVRRRWPSLLFAPILGNESGYGMTYGALLTRPEPAGKESRVAFPLTWGAYKRAGADFEKRFPDRWITRVEAGGSVSRRINPRFDAQDDRRGVYFRPERQFTRSLRVRGLTSWQDVSFRGNSDRFTSIGVEVVLDTRVDPFLARDAIFLKATRSRLAFEQREAVTRTDVEAHGYLGLFGQTILVASARRDAADGSLPDYLKPLLGGPTSVRGFRTGTALGDSLVSGSLELRVPLTSPLKLAKLGVSAFVDAGTAYDDGQRFGDQPLKRGVGGGVWVTAAFLRLNVAVAHGVGASTRVHVNGNVAF